MKRILIMLIATVIILSGSNAITYSGVVETEVEAEPVVVVAKVEPEVVEVEPVVVEPEPEIITPVKKKLPYIVVNASVSAYTASADECGNANGITASGKSVSRGMVAAPQRLSFGTEVQIKGRRYTVEDRGGAIKVRNGVYHIDIFVPTKKEAFEWGRRKLKIRIYQ